MVRLTFLRLRGVGLCLMWIIACAAVQAVAAPVVTSSPFLPPVEFAAWPIVAFAYGCAIPASLSSDAAGLESGADRPMHWYRGALALAYATIAAFGAAAATLRSGALAEVAARNALLSVAVALVCAALLRGGLAWAPLAMYVAAVWLFGHARGGAVWWAVPLRGPGTPMWIATVIVSVTAAVLYAAAGTADDRAARW